MHFHIVFQGKFREDNFSSAMATLRDVGDAAKGDKRGRRGGFKCKKILLTKQKLKSHFLFDS